MFVSVKMVSSLNQYYTGFVQDLKDLDNWRNLAKVKGNLEWFGIIILVNRKSGKVREFHMQNLVRILLHDREQSTCSSLRFLSTSMALCDVIKDDIYDFKNC